MKTGIKKVKVALKKVPYNPPRELGRNVTIFGKTIRSNSDVHEVARHYLKVVEWSEEDRCFIGSAPPIIGPSCHGETEAEVMAQLTTIVEEWVADILKRGEKLPEPTAGKKFSGKFVVRIDPELHRAAAIRAAANQEPSLNRFVEKAIRDAV